jgi:hypothetical protein
MCTWQAGTLEALFVCFLLARVHDFVGLCVSAIAFRFSIECAIETGKQRMSARANTEIGLASEQYTERHPLREKNKPSNSQNLKNFMLIATHTSVINCKCTQHH